VGRGNAGGGGRGEARGDAGHDPERDAGGGERQRLLAAAAEDVRVAALALNTKRWNIESFQNMGILSGNAFNTVEYWEPN
jgi:hypothetical protein